MDIRLPNGTIIRGIPEGTSKDAIRQKAISAGYATEADFGAAPTAEVSPELAAMEPVTPAPLPKDVPYDVPLPTGTAVSPEEIQRRRVEALPEIGAGGLLSGEPLGDIAKSAAMLAVTTDAREMANILSSQYPHIGVVQTERDGPLVAVNSKTGATVVLNKPGLSALDIKQAIGLGAAFTPAAGVAGGVTRAGAGMLARTAAGAGTAAGTQAAIEAAQAGMGGEFQPSEIALAGGLGGAAEAIAPPVREVIRSVAAKVTPRGLAKVAPSVQAAKEVAEARKVGVSPEEVLEPFEPGRKAPIEEAMLEAVRGGEATRGLAAVTGAPEVGLLPAQQTQIPTQLRVQALMSELPESTVKAQQALRTQNKQIHDTVTGLMDTIASPEITATGAEKFRGVAQQARQNIVNARKEAVSPLFKQAYDDASAANLDVDVTPALAEVDRMMEGVREGSTIGKLLTNVREGIEESAATDFRGSNLKPLHNEKRQMRATIQRFEKENGYLDKEIKSKLTQVTQQLTRQLRDASPVYNEAMDTFIAGTPGLEAFDASILGKIAKLPDERLKTVSQTIFDPAQTNPTVIKNAKKAISEVDPSAWNDLTRIELERRAGAAIADLVGTTPEGVPNVPGLLRRSIFGNPKQKQVLYAGLDPDQRKNFEWLDSVLKKTSAGRHVGSSTVSNLEARDFIRGGVGKALSAVSKPLKTMQDIGDSAMFQRDVNVLARTLLNPEFKIAMKKIRRMNPMRADAFRAFSQVLRDSADLEFQRESPQEPLTE